MNDKRNAIVTIGIIAAMILVFTVADLVTEDRKFSESENRLLATKPEFTTQALFAGEYSEDYEAYVTDQFVGRDKWIALKTMTDILLQKKDMNGVYLGADDYLIEQHLPENYTREQEEQKIALLEKLVERWNARVMLVPTADNILTDKLPEYALYYDQTRFLSDVQEAVGEENYIDVYHVLQEHAEEEIYYRTDHHWTSLGAYYGYRAWAEKMGKFPLFRDLERREVVTDDFLGTLHSRINLPMDGEEISYFYDTQKRPVTVTYDFSETMYSFYEESHLNTKNKYGFFLDDNHAFVEITTTTTNGKSLFVIKDSYANCLIPMLAQHYEKVYVLDLRYFNSRLFTFMEQYEAEEEMDVLVLYNCIHFLEDFKYFE
uniref:DHHW family protein n=1 Tax=Acetatifactor sp. TaxID=1872090 RepID=UPI0040568DE1